MADDDKFMALVRMLARYLRDNPMACDTPAGIARWWLADPTRESPVREAALGHALDWLEARKLIEKLHAADGRVRYRRASGDSDFEARVRAALETSDNGLPPVADDDLPGHSGKRVH